MYIIDVVLEIFIQRVDLTTRSVSSVSYTSQKMTKKKKMTDLEVCVNVICDLIISLFVLKLSQILHVI